MDCAHKCNISVSSLQKIICQYINFYKTKVPLAHVVMNCIQHSFEIVSV